MSRTKRMDGVPEFTTTTDCERFVAECNTTAAKLRDDANKQKAMARNAANQVRAIVLSQTLDDVTQGKLKFNTPKASDSMKPPPGGEHRYELTAEQTDADVVEVPPNTEPTKAEAMQTAAITKPFYKGWYSVGIGATEHYVDHSSGEFAGVSLCGKIEFDPLPRIVAMDSGGAIQECQCKSCWALLHNKPNSEKPVEKKKAKKKAKKKTTRKTAAKTGAK